MKHFWLLPSRCVLYLSACWLQTSAGCRGRVVAVQPIANWEPPSKRQQRDRE